MSRKQDQSLHIAIRFTRSNAAPFTKDPIGEHQKVLAAHGRLGFGKVGKALSQSLAATLSNQAKAEPTYLYLFYKDTRGKGDYDCYRMRIRSVENAPIADLPTPEYYSRLDGIGTWFEVSDMQALGNDIAETLKLASTGAPLSAAFKSMSSTFAVKSN